MAIFGEPVLGVDEAEPGWANVGGDRSRPEKVVALVDGATGEPRSLVVKGLAEVLGLSVQRGAVTPLP